jgi:hypothetical protein
VLYGTVSAAEVNAPGLWSFVAFVALNEGCNDKRADIIFCKTAQAQLLEQHMHMRNAQ